MEDIIILKLTKEEFEYIKEVIHNLAQVKVPKCWKSRKSEILAELDNRFSNNSIN